MTDLASVYQTVADDRDSGLDIVASRVINLDRHGNPIVNSAGEPYPPEAIQRPDGRWIVYRTHDMPAAFNSFIGNGLDLMQ